MKPIYAFLLGVYLCGLCFVFFIVGIMACLGGDEQDLWRPFVYGLFWPLSLPAYFFGLIQ